MLFSPTILLYCFAGIDAALIMPLKQTTKPPPYVKNSTIARRNADPNSSLKDQGSWFSIDIGFGNPKKVLPGYLDSGSDQTWVAVELWDPTTSSTFVNQTNELTSCYASGECLLGYGIEDSMWIGDNEAKNSLFVIDVSSPDSEHALIGMGWADYDNFPYTVKTAGLTKTASYSIWMNAAGRGDGSICFGGIDQSKYKGQLGVVENRNFPITYDDNGNVVTPDRPAIFTTPLNGIKAKSADGTVQDVVVDSSAPIMFDTGTTGSNMPRDWLEALGAAWGCKWDDDYNSEMCGYEPSGSVIFNFSGVEVEIDVAKLMEGRWTSGDDAHWDYGFIFSERVADLTKDTIGFGNNWQRYVYMVTDMDTRQFAFANALTGDEVGDKAEDIVEIEYGIPNAYTGSLYGTEYHTSSTVVSVTNFGTYTYTPTARH